MRVKKPLAKVSENRHLLEVGDLISLTAYLDHRGTCLLVHTALSTTGKPSLTLFEAHPSYSKSDAVMGRLVKGRDGRWKSIRT